MNFKYGLTFQYYAHKWNENELLTKPYKQTKYTV